MNVDIVLQVVNILLGIIATAAIPWGITLERRLTKIAAALERSLEDRQVIYKLQERVSHLEITVAVLTQLPPKKD